MTYHDRKTKTPKRHWVALWGTLGFIAYVLLLGLVGWIEKHNFF